MSRFSSLEFGGDLEGDFDPQQVTKDEQFYLNEAAEAFARGRFEAALRSFAKVLEFNPKNAAAWTGQVRALIELGECVEAKMWADKALEKFPTEPELLASKAVALGRIGDLKAALAFSDASIEERGDTPYIWLARGDVLLAAEEKRAEYCFQKALIMAPTDWLVRWLASRIHYVYNKFATALKLAQEALNINATNAVLWLQVGQCQAAMGLVTAAENSFTQAKELDPACVEADRALLQVAKAGFFSRLSGQFRQLFQKS